MVNVVNAFALPHTLTKQIIQRAGGNPFFIEEVVRSLIDQGAIVLKEGRFAVTEKVSEIPIPNTINDILMARIDRLEEKTRQLVKVASVIGRNFFYRILSYVASEVEDIPDKLSFLSEIQLLQPQERMGEVEYLFKHALAQEAAYESILPPKRRELHLKVAHSIEKIFSERLPEFYGMLAYHYSRAEDLEKAEEYLIKAGKEALRSAASDEALHYYEEALQLYLEKSGPDADPEKVAMLEKNIALALYNRGQHQEAIKHFDTALDHYWGKLPKGKVFVAIKLLSAFVHLLATLYLPFLKFRKTPTEGDVEVISLFSKKCRSLAVIDTKRFLVESLYLHKIISAFDLQKLQNGAALFAGVSALFSFGGISFKLSRKILDVIRDKVEKGDIRDYTIFELCETFYNFLKGNWEELRDYDDDLVDRNCKIGEIWDASTHLYWHGLGNIWQGSFDKAKSVIDKLNELFEVYQNDLSKIFAYELHTYLLIKSQRLNEALIESEQGIEFGEKVHSAFWDLHTCQAWIYLLTGDIEKSERCFQRAEKIRRQIQAAPFQLSNLYRIQLEIDLYRLREWKGGNRVKAHESQRKAIRSAKQLLAVTRKVARHRTDSYRLMGAYYWMINKQGKALRWWHRAVQEGERLGARPQVARTYLEVGKRLLEPESKYRDLDGLGAKEYLKKARALFEEMGLQSDLDELDQVVKV
jgi:tetratricopeptide (TPR) repeat protein